MSASAQPDSNIATASAPPSKPRRGPGRPFPPGVSGTQRAAERARLDEAARQVEVAGILADLGRTPTHLERLLIGELAAQAVRARRLRGQGKPSDQCAMLMARIAGRLGLGSRKGGKPPQPALAEFLAAMPRQPAADDDDDAPSVEASPARRDGAAAVTLASEPAKDLAGVPR